jgi:hypothetical protein
MHYSIIARVYPKWVEKLDNTDTRQEQPEPQETPQPSIVQEQVLQMTQQVPQKCPEVDMNLIILHISECDYCKNLLKLQMNESNDTIGYLHNVLPYLIILVVLLLIVYD